MIEVPLELSPLQALRSYQFKCTKFEAKNPTTAFEINVVLIKEFFTFVFAILPKVNYLERVGSLQ